MFHRSYYIAAGLLIFVLLLPWLLTRDIAANGAIYASIARNLAEGIGSFWAPLASQDAPVFNEHPPLAFGLQALFFLVLGDHWFIERIYSLITALLTSWAIVELWKTFYSDRHQRRLLWLPVVFWISVPVVFWSYRNNMVDNTLTVFTTFASLFMLRACVLRAGEFLVLGVVFTIAAFFTKGINGVFPLFIPMLYGLYDYRHGFLKGTIQTLLICLLASAFVSGILYIIPAARENVFDYFTNHVSVALQSIADVTNHASLLISLFKHLTPLLFCLLAVSIMRLRSRRAPSEIRRNAWFMLGMSMLAVLPLILMNEHSTNSLLTTIPFFAITFSTMVMPRILESMEQRSIAWRNFGFAFNVLATGALVVLCFVYLNKPARYNQLISDADNISTGVENCKIVSCDWNTAEDRQLNAYLQRMHRIQLVGGTEYEYLLMKKTSNLNPPSGYEAQLIPLNNYVLYKKSDKNFN